MSPITTTITTTTTRRRVPRKPKLRLVKRSKVVLRKVSVRGGKLRRRRTF